MPTALRTIRGASVPLVPANLTGVAALRSLVSGRASHERTVPAEPDAARSLPDLEALVDELADAGPGAVLLLSKGGVGKTTIAAAIAVALARRGHDVHLSTTDPAGRLTDVLADDTPEHLTVSRIDPAAELAGYTAARLHATERFDPDRRALLEEDLRSPCTEELAVFGAFSALLSEARGRFVIIDTAPSGHTLRLLDLTGSYHRQVMQGAGTVHTRITTPIMRLQDPNWTRMLIVTHPALTPVAEAAALQDDLRRADIEPFGWVVNASLTGTSTRDPLRRARAALERPHLQRVRDELAARAWLVPWHTETVIGEAALGAIAQA